MMNAAVPRVATLVDRFLGVSRPEPTTTVCSSVALGDYSVSWHVCPYSSCIAMTLEITRVVTIDIFRFSSVFPPAFKVPT